MSVEITLPSIFDVAPLETGGVEARAGFVFQDHVAARYCLMMLELSSLQQVWCEDQDDITLIWEESSDITVEFVQVKSNQPDQLWTVALLCHRKKKRKPHVGEKPQPDGGSIHELSILEKSLCYDRVREPCRFRIVTSRDVKSELSVLKLPLSDPARSPRSPQFEDLRNKIPEPIRTFVSESGRNFESWLRNTVWEVLDTAENLENRNRVLLDRLMDRHAHYLSFDQRDTVYAKVLARVQKAAVSNSAVSLTEKRISRSDFMDWLKEVAQEALHPLSAGSTDTLKLKMAEADLPQFAIDSAVEQRRSYLLSYRSRAFLDLSSKQMVVSEVRSELSRLTSDLNSGVLSVSGVEFHGLCLTNLARLSEELSETVTPKRHVPRSFLDGCMYDMTNRCTHRFNRESA